MKPLAVAALLSIAAATPLLAGPPWITVELRPMGSSFVVVHTFHHGTPNPMALRGTAEGLVDGRRLSVPLRFAANPQGSGNYDVEKAWTDQGVWVLNISTAEDSHLGAGATVLIDRGGTASVRFPRSFDGQSRAATGGEIEATLRALDAGQAPHGFSRSGWWKQALLPLALLGALTWFTAKLVASIAKRLRTRDPHARRTTHDVPAPTPTR